MKSKLSVRLQLDGYEDRCVLSAVSPPAVVQTAPSIPAILPACDLPLPTPVSPQRPVPAQLALRGWLAGQVYNEPTNPFIADYVPRKFLSGTANLQGLGRVRVEGFVQAVGYVPQGQARGSLTLTKIGDPRSTMTLELRGPTQTAGSLPSTWTVRVVSATGSYTGISGETTLKLTLNSTTQIATRVSFHGRM